MASFSLVIEYLTGYTVATDPSSRERAEWPPHPARVYMALAAAHFETDGSPDDKCGERDALEWLATLPQPDLVIPNHTARDVLSVYVPVNDQSSGDALVKRSRQPRTFPRVYVGGDPVCLIYRVDPEHHAQHLAALEAICRHVTRIGHSSSLVWVRLERNGSHSPTHQPDESGLGVRYRTPFGSILRHLTELWGDEDRLKHAAETDRVLEELTLIKRDIAKLKKKGDKSSVESLEKTKRDLDARAKADPHPPIRPSISHTTSYQLVNTPAPTTPASIFDPNFIILREADEATQTFGLESTEQVLAALRGLIQKKSPQPPPSWVSGHEPGGEKLQSSPHIALIPLAFVGSPYADGHLMGLGIVFPRGVSHRERASVFAKMLFDEEKNQEALLTLRMKEAGEWKVVLDASQLHQQTLKVDTYVRASRIWASVTPVVLDQMPKADRTEDPCGWRKECEIIIKASCVNIGLPAPIAVRVEKTPFFNGSLRAMPGQGGFPQLRRDKFQVHAMIEFDQPVIGPVLIGAGRYRGYGLCRPWGDH